MYQSGIIYDSLVRRHKDNRPIRIGLIGFGYMGKGIFDQIMHYPSVLKLKSAYNRTLQKIDGLRKYGITVTDDWQHITKDPEIELIIECTGTIDFAFKVSMDAIINRKSVLSMNCELQVTYGDVLYNKSLEYDVVYSDCGGDQPGVLSNLHDRICLMGLQPLVYGSMKGYYNKYATWSDMSEYHNKTGQSYELLTSATDGTKMHIEQALIANHLDLQLPKNGMTGMYLSESSNIREISNMYNVDELCSNQKPMIDYIIQPRNPAVFILATTQNKSDRSYLATYKISDGPLYVFYEPYHLCHYDIIPSIIRVCDYKQCIVSSRKKNVEVCSIAKRDILKDEIIDGIGGNTVYGICHDIRESRINQYVPIGIIKNCRALKNITKNSIIEYQDISITI